MASERVRMDGSLGEMTYGFCSVSGVSGDSNAVYVDHLPALVGWDVDEGRRRQRDCCGTLRTNVVCYVFPPLDTWHLAPPYARAKTLGLIPFTVKKKPLRGHSSKCTLQQPSICESHPVCPLSSLNQNSQRIGNVQDLQCGRVCPFTASQQPQNPSTAQNQGSSSRCSQATRIQFPAWHGARTVMTWELGRQWFAVP